jgi:hypothetical protein
MRCREMLVAFIHSIAKSASQQLVQNAFPDKKLFAKVWKVTQTPVNAVLLVVVLQTLFGLLYLASFAAVSPSVYTSFIY